jgi:hypothetical protein
MSLVERARAKLENFAGAEISSRSLGLIRIFGAILVIFRLAPKLSLHRFDDPYAPLCAAALLLSCLFMIPGYKTRWFAVIAAISLGVLHIYYGQRVNNTLLAKPVLPFQMMVLLALTPSGRSLSIDRVLEVRRARREGRDPPPETMPWWQLELFLLTIASLYFWAAMNKTDARWLRGERMERYWLMWFGGSDSFVYSPLVHPLSVMFAWATTILEFVLAFGLMSRRFRHWVMWGGIALHVGILYTLSVPYFSMLMFTLLFAAAKPDKIHEYLSLLADDGIDDPRGPPDQAQPSA